MNAIQPTLSKHEYDLLIAKRREAENLGHQRFEQVESCRVSKAYDSLEADRLAFEKKYSARQGKCAYTIRLPQGSQNRKLCATDEQRKRHEAQKPRFNIHTLRRWFRQMD
eukprot:CAMPEP_0204337528 /NCGR_PEP_ID=MMETSP0469-20131031/20387_1 /ASSEMBLY_ACC=CAM_ASM_000384 /TAXON_ID=2969 /ORGANISM="Oxyrrhis marina" /LENGTH=109 /DNA_ID=CAMNT_0051321573 /DNA_START=21 /DNA_END=347 /DNA_ORIENTATION=+